MRFEVRNSGAVLWGRGGRVVLALALVAGAAMGEGTGAPAPSPAPDTSLVVDRAVVRFSSSDSGGTAVPYFVHERELAFEARLIALSDRAFRGESEPYRRHHLQAALERHIAEVLLSVLALDPEPSGEVVARQRTAAWVMAEQDTGGADRLALAAKAEGLGTLELRRLFHRRARASLYLDQMVAPMLEPSELELKRAYQSGDTPYSDRPYGEVRTELRDYYVSQALRLSAASFFQRARARLKIEYL